MMDGAMYVILAVVAEIPHDAGRIFDSEAGVDEKNHSPRPLSKK
jgi:hypothetical protein